MKIKIPSLVRVFALTFIVTVSTSCEQGGDNANARVENTLRNSLTITTNNFFHFLEKKDIDSWIELWTEDGVDIKPYASGMFPEKLQGKQTIYDSWKRITEVFDRVRFPIHEMIVDEERRTVAVRLDGEGHMKNGNLYENTYIFLFHYDHNMKILNCYEYFNPYIAGENFGTLDKLNY